MKSRIPIAIIVALITTFTMAGWVRPVVRHEIRVDRRHAVAVPAARRVANRHYYRYERRDVRRDVRRDRVERRYGY